MVGLEEECMEEISKANAAAAAEKSERKAARAAETAAKEAVKAEMRTPPREAAVLGVVSAEDISEFTHAPESIID